MNCKECNGAGWVEVPNYHLDCMEWQQCHSCLAEEYYHKELEEGLTKLLVNASHERLAQIVATLLVRNVSRNPQDSLDRLETIIQTKNTLEAIQIASFI